jgi:uncharacterized membrane protein YphA (DoxX/SURF4 family)
MIDRIDRLYRQVDQRLTLWMARNGLLLLRWSLGIVFFWFGVLKFFPGTSAAEGLAARTIEIITFGMITPRMSVLLLATWETLIGIGLMIGVGMRFTLLLMFVQMLGTITPLFFFPAETFVRSPFVPTLEGQYIIKNVVLISAGLVLGATVRGGELTAEPATET